MSNEISLKEALPVDKYYTFLDSAMREISANPDIQMFIDILDKFKAGNRAMITVLEEKLSEHFGADISILIWLKNPVIFRPIDFVKILGGVRLNMTGNKFVFTHRVKLGVSLTMDQRTVMTSKEMLAMIIAQIGYLGAYYTAFERVQSMFQFVSYLTGSIILRPVGSLLEKAYRENEGGILNKVRELFSKISSDENSGYWGSRISAIANTIKTVVLGPISFAQVLMGGRSLSLTAGTRVAAGANIVGFYGLFNEYSSAMAKQLTISASSSTRYMNSVQKPVDIRIMETVNDILSIIGKTAQLNLTSSLNEKAAQLQHREFLVNELNSAARGIHTEADLIYLKELIAQVDVRIELIDRKYASGSESGVLGIRNFARNLESFGIKLSNAIFQKGSEKTDIAIDDPNTDKSAFNRIF